MSSKPAYTHHDLMYYIRRHERAWGKTYYPGRPSLNDMLRAPVVVFWLPADDMGLLPYRYTATTHLNLKEMRHYFSRLIIHSHARLPDQRVVQIFFHRQPVRIRGVHLLLEYDE